MTGEMKWAEEREELAVAMEGYDSSAMPIPDESLIAEAGRRLAEAAPDARVILFGSHARGEAGPDSDLDLLVIEPELESRRAEFVRLRQELRGLKVPIDLVLVSDRHVEEWGHFEGTMLNDALNEGRVLAGT
jgi:uncharacterized protein